MENNDAHKLARALAELLNICTSLDEGIGLEWGAYDQAVAEAREALRHYRGKCEKKIKRHEK